MSIWQKFRIWRAARKLLKLLQQEELETIEEFRQSMADETTKVVCETFGHKCPQPTMTGLQMQKCDRCGDEIVVYVVPPEKSAVIEVTVEVKKESKLKKYG